MTGAVDARIAAARAALDAAFAADPRIAAARETLTGLNGDDAEAVANRVAPLLVRGGWVAAMLRHMRGAVRDEPLLDPPLAAAADARHASMVLFDDDAVRISLVVLDPAGLDPAPPAVALDGMLTLHRVLRPAGLRIERWAGAAIGAGFTTAAAPTVSRGAILCPGAGTLVRIDGRLEGALMLAAHGHPVLLRATIRAGRAAFARIHSTADGRFLSASSTDEAGSRMAMLASWLAAMRVTDSADAVALLLHDPDFSLRWLGARTLLAIDRAAGVAALDRLAAADPHPEVRAAAAAARPRLAA